MFDPMAITQSEIEGIEFCQSLSCHIINSAILSIQFRNLRNIAKTAQC